MGYWVGGGLEDYCVDVQKAGNSFYTSRVLMGGPLDASCGMLIKRDINVSPASDDMA